MDPFSGESELLNITTAFYTHAYPTVLEFDISSLSAQNRPTAQTLKYRAQIALGQSREVVSALSQSKDPVSQSLVALAQHTAGQPSGFKLATQLADSEPEDATVQICAGTVLASAGEPAKAIDLLSKHQGNLEAVALLVQIHLSQHRTDLAIKEVQAAKRWAQDSLLINLAEAWTNLRVGGNEKYQSAFYVYEELASASGTTSTSALVGQAIAEIHLGRVEEAEAALNQAMESNDANVEAVANSIVLTSVLGRSAAVADLVEKLRSLDAEHALLRDLEEKDQLFGAAAGKYAAKAAS